MADTHVWGIFGGGFGLYGYLPALAKFGDTEVVLLDKHKAFIEEREELSQYSDLIKWVSSPEEIISEAGSLIIAVPPVVQEKLVRSLLLNKRFQYILIEKPVATTPRLGKKVLEQVIGRAKAVRVGFSFLYAPWADKVRKDKCFLEKNSYLIQWKFMAYHFKENLGSWKEEHKLGGGALRFYGIHLIAFLESLGHVSVIFSRLFQDMSGRIIRWKACFSIKGGATVTVDVDSYSVNEQFAIYRAGELQVPLLQARTPFSGVIQYGNEDNRIIILEKVIGTFDSPNKEFYDLYSRINTLWERVEHVTESVQCNAK